ncbi:MAG: hypothetical protein WBA74_27050 [Cyclobacteriaceae bacterium]
MKKAALFTLLAVGYIITIVDAKNPTSEKEDYEWLISEVEELYEDEASVMTTESMVFVYDEKGNEIIRYQESEYDNLSADIKRKVSQSDFLFNTMGDSFYIIAE